MSNKEWIDLIAKEFHCSKSIAKEMLHSMYETRKLKTISILKANAPNKR